MSAPIKDSDKGHWVNRSPLSVRPYLQLSRLDRPIGYWLLALPGWIGLSFATLSHGFHGHDKTSLDMAVFAMRGWIDCPAVPSKAGSDYLIMLYPPRRGLPFYETHHMVASALARPDL